MATNKISIRDLAELPTRTRGPKEWVPTDKEIEAVRLMAAVDFTEAAIASVLRITQTLFTEAKGKYPNLAQTLKIAKKEVEWGLYKQIADFVKDPEVPYERKRKDIMFLLGRKHGWKESADNNGDKQMLPGTIDFQQVDKINPEVMED